jgi:glyoxylase-like metal-dependent hydrolase (beta-lactamase superfamily II)
MPPSEVAPGVVEIPLLRVKAHLLVDGGGQDLTLVDAGPPGSGAAITRAVTRLGHDPARLRRILCTHGHPDHAGGARELLGPGRTVHLHPADREAIEIGLGDVVRQPSLGRVFAALTPRLPQAEPLADGQVLPVLGGLEVVHVPGHTPGSVCFYAARDGLLFVGDSLEHRRGRVSYAHDVFSDDPLAARRATQRMAALRVETIIFSHWRPVRGDARRILAELARGA